MLFKTTLAAAAVTLASLSPAQAEQDAPILGYTMYGTGPEHVMVLHNWMGDARSFDAMRPWLDDHSYTYVFADVRGYGNSKTLKGKYTTDEIARDTLHLADELGWDKFNLIGHSMNGMAGFKTLMRDSEQDKRIKSYVAITPVTPDGYPASEDDRAFLLATISEDEMARAAFDALSGGKLNNAWKIRNTTYSRTTTSPDVLKGYYDMWLDEDFSKEFQEAEIDTPILLIGGRNDLPGFQQEYYDKTIANWAQNIHLAYIENAGHYPMLETPVLLATMIEDHLSANK